MTITDDFLTINEYSRPGKKLKEILAVIMHWTANPLASAKANRDFFNSKKTGMSGYGSSHYIIGLQGEIIRCIPENEVAYHCGSSQLDPASGKIYTNLARQKFPSYTNANSSPNFCTLGIELCPVDWEGNFKTETIESATELCADILRRHKLTTEDILTHQQVVGWKDCPKLWVDNPNMFELFKENVGRII